MWKLVKKNIYYFLPLFIIALSATILLRFVAGGPLEKGFVIPSGIFIYIFTLGSIFINEQHEEKNKGYAFLASLPIGAREIVTTKFLIIFLSIFLFAGMTILQMYFPAGNPDYLNIARSFILLNACLCLIIGAFIYIGIFAIGYTKFLIVFTSLLVIIQLIPFTLAATKNREVLQSFYLKTREILPQLNWIIIIPLILVVYLGLMTVAIRIKEKKDI